MLKISLVKTFIWNLLKFHNLSQEQINKERFFINILSSLVAITFIIFFTYIEKIPVEYVFSIYCFVTEDLFKFCILISALTFFSFAVYYKNFSYILLISAFSFGQLLFVYIYDDRYSLGSKFKEVEFKKIEIKHYSVHWNIG